jgi:hypothetical protein
MIRPPNARPGALTDSVHRIGARVDSACMQPRITGRPGGVGQMFSPFPSRTGAAPTSFRARVSAKLFFNGVTNER